MFVKLFGPKQKSLNFDLLGGTKTFVFSGLSAFSCSETPASKSGFGVQGLNILGRGEEGGGTTCKTALVQNYLVHAEERRKEKRARRRGPNHDLRRARSVSHAPPDSTRGAVLQLHVLSGSVNRGRTCEVSSSRPGGRGRRPPTRACHWGALQRFPIDIQQHKNRLRRLEAPGAAATMVRIIP